MTVILARLPPPCQHTQKAPDGGTLQAAQQMRNAAPITRSKINTLRLPLRQFAQSNLQKIVQISENQFFSFWAHTAEIRGIRISAKA